MATKRGQFIPRQYQNSGVNALWQAFAERSGHINPLCVMPTGTGYFAPFTSV